MWGRSQVYRPSKPNQHSQTPFHRLMAHANLASASMSFLSDFWVGVSVYLGVFSGFVRFDGINDRSSDVVDRAVEVDFIDMASFSSRESMLARYADVISSFCYSVQLCVVQVVRLSEMHTISARKLMTTCISREDDV